MKIKSFGILTAAMIMASAGAANAGILFNFYTGGTYGIGGYTLFSDQDISHSSQSYGAIFGVDIPLARFELEYNYMDSDNTTLNIGLVNAYLKLPTPVIKPYIGAGIGTTFESSKFNNIEIQNTVAYQGMLGITLDIPAIPFNIDLEGRVLYASDLFKVATNEYDLLQYEGRVKIRYMF